MKVWIFRYAQNDKRHSASTRKVATKRPLRQKPSKAKSQLKSALTRATKASQAQAQRIRPLQHKFLVANSLLKELAAQKRKGHTMKRLLLIITLVLFSAGFITEAFAAPARGGGQPKELPSDHPQLTKQHSTQRAQKRTKSARVKPKLNPRLH